MIALIIYFVGVGIVLATLIYYWFLDNRSITLREVMILCLVSLFSWIIIIIALLMYWDERIEKRKLRKRQTVALLIGAVFLLGTTAFTSCEEGGPIHAPMGSGTAPFYQTIVIDSCEYIEAFNKLAHKGNCRFCAERHRSGLKEIAELNNNDNYDKDSI